MNYTSSFIAFNVRWIRLFYPVRTILRRRLTIVFSYRLYTCRTYTGRIKHSTFFIHELRENVLQTFIFYTCVPSLGVPAFLMVLYA